MTALTEKYKTETHTKLSYMEAIVQAQKEEMLRDDRVILIGEDIATYGGGALFDTFGEKRLWSTPISENAFTGMAVGAAMTGLRPIVDLTIASFVYLASDQIINQAAKLRYMTGANAGAGGVSRLYVLWQRSCRPAFGSTLPAIYEYPRTENTGAVHCRRYERAAKVSRAR